MSCQQLCGCHKQESEMLIRGPAQVDRLTQELMRADDYAAEKERDFINAKEARRVIAARLAEAK